jgi:hypothetical protein
LSSLRLTTVDGRERLGNAITQPKAVPKGLLSHPTVRRVSHGVEGWTSELRRAVQATREGELPMWTMAVPWWEFLVRGAIVYLFLIVLLRLSGKRQVGQLAPFDLVLLLVLSNAVQNSMNGGDNSVIGGLLSASTLVALNWVIGYVTFRSKRFEQFVEGKPQIIIHDGHVYRDVMNRERLTQHELEAALRAAGCAAITDVHFAILENNGQISVRRKDKS